MKIEPFLRLVNKTKSCWLWTGGVDRHGYGRVHIKRNGVDGTTGAHRRMYELMNGPIPTGMELDHLCRDPGCVNPKHLEPVTHLENVRRGENAQSLQTRCKNGHEYSLDNTYVKPGGHRHCRACSRERSRLYRERKAK